MRYASLVIVVLMVLPLTGAAMEVRLTQTILPSRSLVVDSSGALQRIWNAVGVHDRRYALHVVDENAQPQPVPLSEGLMAQYRAMLEGTSLFERDAAPLTATGAATVVQRLLVGDAVHGWEERVSVIQW